MLNWARLPDMCECILPHDHCPFLPTVFFSTLNVKLRLLKAICKFYLCWLAIMASRWVTILFTVLIRNKIENELFYPWILATTRIYLHSVFFHERDHHFAMKFGVIVHDEKLQTIVFTLTFLPVNLRGAVKNSRKNFVF